MVQKRKKKKTKIIKVKKKTIIVSPSKLFSIRLQPSIQCKNMIMYGSYASLNNLVTLGLRAQKHMIQHSVLSVTGRTSTDASRAPSVARGMMNQLIEREGEGGRE